MTRNELILYEEGMRCLLRSRFSPFRWVRV